MLLLFDWITKYYTLDVKEELGQILHIALPLIAASLWSYLMSPVSLMFCGHLGTTVLDGVSIAGSLINIAGISVATGLSAACDTLFSQTYGSGNYYQLGIYLQRSILIVGLSLLPCWGFLINARAFLALINQDPSVSNVAAKYLDRFLFGLPGCFAFILLSKYLQNQNILYPTIIIGAIGNGLNALLHYLLIWVVGMGFDGSAYAQAISFDAMGVMSLGYILIWNVYANQWPGWGHHCLTEWGPFMRLAIPSLIMICVESWSIEVGVFLSGLVGVVQQSAQSVLFQVQTITDMFTIGFGSASSIRIGQHLGRGNPAMAKTSAILCLIITVIVASIIAAILTGLHQFIPMAFSDDRSVTEIVSNLLPVLGIGFIVDALSAISGGIGRGCGRQMTGSIINAIGYYGIALPVGIPLTICWKIIDPLWYALFGALTVTSIIFFIVIIRINWSKEAQLAAERCHLDNNDVTKEEENQHNISIMTHQSSVINFTARRTSWATLSNRSAVALEQHQRRQLLTKTGRTQSEILIIAENSSQNRKISVESLPLIRTSSHNRIFKNYCSTLTLTPLKATVEADETMVTEFLAGSRDDESGRQFRQLILKRLLAVSVCFTVLAISLVLRLTIFNNYDDDFLKIMTIIANQSITTTSKVPKM